MFPTKNNNSIKRLGWLSVSDFKAKPEPILQTQDEGGPVLVGSEAIILLVLVRFNVGGRGVGGSGRTSTFYPLIFVITLVCLVNIYIYNSCYIISFFS